MAQALNDKPHFVYGGVLRGMEARYARRELPTRLGYTVEQDDGAIVHVENLGHMTRVARFSRGCVLIVALAKRR